MNACSVSIFFSKKRNTCLSLPALFLFLFGDREVIPRLVVETIFIYLMHKVTLFNTNPIKALLMRKIAPTALVGKHYIMSIWLLRKKGLNVAEHSKLKQASLDHPPPPPFPPSPNFRAKPLNAFGIPKCLKWPRTSILTLQNVWTKNERRVYAFLPYVEPKCHSWAKATGTSRKLISNSGCRIHPRTSESFSSPSPFMLTENLINQSNHIEASLSLLAEPHLTRE